MIRGLSSTVVNSALLLASGINPLDPGRHSALHPAALQGRQIEWLYWVIFWICLAVFVLMIAMFAASGSRAYAHTDGDPPPVTEDEDGDRRASWVVGSAVGITTLTLFVVLVLSIITGKKVQGVESNNGVTIQIKGHQWWWEVTYPNSQADLTVTTANEIHVPVGERVVIVTSSSDVIHSFWAPNITGKRDLIPGYSSAISFQIDTPGTYHGQCAEFCGLQHAHMGFSVVAEQPDEFAAWQQQQIASAREPTDAASVRGREVFMTHSCIMCHSIRGTEAGSHVGPDLTHVGSRQMIAAETLPNNPGALGGWILDPQRLKPGTLMPANALSGDDLQSLITYLQNLK